MIAEESVDNINKQIESISNNETNSHYNDSQSALSSVLKRELGPTVDKFTVKYDRRNLIVDLDRTFIDIMEYTQYSTKLRSMHA